MPSWTDVLREIQAQAALSPLDVVRRKYLAKLSEKTGRNVIAYYSGFLQKDGKGLDINDNDKNSFMAVIHGLDRSKGLDLILHTPGGNVFATESLVNYLKIMFDNDIRVIVPQIAMSAGTMIACASKEIIMGKQSNIGPIDPQYGNIPCYGVLDEFKKAVDDIEREPKTKEVWKVIISKYHPTFVGECQNAIDVSKHIVTVWLETNMLKDDKDRCEKTRIIVDKLSDHSDSKNHSRHYHIEDVKALGLNVTSMEDDNELQDLVLTVHHCFMHTFSNSVAYKIVENHQNGAVISNQKS